MLGIIGGTSLLFSRLPDLERRVIHTPFGNSEVLCGECALASAAPAQPSPSPYQFPVTPRFTGNLRRYPADYHRVSRIPEERTIPGIGDHPL